MDQDSALNPTPAPVATEASVDSDEEITGKEYVVEKLTELIGKSTGQIKGAKTLARAAFKTVVETMFQAAVADGYFRFPGGFGALKLTHIAEAMRKTPASAEPVLCPARFKIKLVEGKTAKALANAPVVGSPTK